MRRFVSVVSALVLSVSVAFSQEALNSRHDGIVGEYEVLHSGECARVKVSMSSDSTFTAQVVWVDDMYDKHGRLRLDRRNPDRSLRGVRCDEIVLFEGLRYDPVKKRWGDTVVYDPTRGFRCPVTCEFRKDKGLRVRLSFLCFVQSCFWRKLDAGQEGFVDER